MEGLLLEKAIEALKNFENDNRLIPKAIWEEAQAVIEEFEKSKKMKVREKLEQMCIDRGMSKNQAKGVLDLAIPKMSRLVIEYSITWDSESSEYPELIYDVLFLTVKEEALSWIDKNVPQAWFREMFV